MTVERQNPFDVPVTRQISLKNEKNRENQTPKVSAISDIFCDWVSIYQTHEQPVPLVNDGCVMKYDGHGELEFTTLRKCRIEGSHASAVFVRSDGHTVWFEGNVSKLGRPDNVFGYTFEECITRINNVVLSLGLPPFTGGKFGDRQKSAGQWEKVYTGARITRLDVTQNFSAGSKENAFQFMRFLASQQASRQKTGVFGEGETIDYGRGSRYVYSKAYQKGAELRRHAKPIPDPLNPLQKAVDPYLLALADWCDAVGLIRFESTYKSTYLIHANQQYLGGIDMAVIHADFETRKEVFTRAKLDVDHLADLEPKLLSVYRMWQAGDDLTKKYSKPTFYRHRAKLLPFGVDISIASNVAQFTPKTRVITLGPCTPPAFYERPHFTHLSLAA